MQIEILRYLCTNALLKSILTKNTDFIHLAHRLQHHLRKYEEANMKSLGLAKEKELSHCVLL